jgi:hypothetical protein
MSRLIATQVTVKDLQEVSKLHEKASQDGEDGTVTQITVDPKASLNFRGMVFVFPTRNLGCMFSHSEREKVKSVRLNLVDCFISISLVLICGFDKLRTRLFCIII